MRQQTLGQGTGHYVVGPLELAPDDMLVVVAGRRVWLTHHAIGYRLEPEPREEGS